MVGFPEDHNEFDDLLETDMNLIDTLKALSGYWHYEGGKYLAKLTSGKVSDTYCNLSVLTCKPAHLQDSVRALVRRFVAALPSGPVQFSREFMQMHLEKIEDWGVAKGSAWESIHVCGPAMGGVTLAYEVARQLGGTAIWFDDAGKPSQPIPKDATVLLVTDHIKHGVQHILTEEFADHVAQHLGGLSQILPYILCLVDTSCADVIETKVKHAVTPEQKAGLPLVQAKMLHIIPLVRLSVREWDSLKAASEDIGCHACRKCVGNPEETCDQPTEMLEAVTAEELVKGLSDAEFCDKTRGL